ncbi:hypothetical protein [Limnobaculum xujianqingii]|uniref:hypothetical protein n=1 Tax=Limnobaculum xujianqingii TaxID=2738837 RepID=UPI0011265932|nr:hypothetical protein [Limnobaculum xujianqingii]
MFIQTDKSWRNNLITYKDINLAYSELIAKQSKRLNDLRNASNELIFDYERSLGLERNVWEDLHGNEREYTTFGVIENDKFIEKSIHQIKMDTNFSLSYSIKTVVNDTPLGGDHVLISVSIRIEDNNFIIDVGNGAAQFIISHDGGKGKFGEVSESIKALVISSLTSKHLN